MPEFQCSSCGESHDLSELSLGAEAPAHWDDAEHANAEDCELSSDQCVIHGQSFFIRGCLEIPIQDSDESFTWGVWTTLSEENFWKIGEEWDEPSRVNLGPHFGWFSTVIPGYPDTINLKCMVHHRPPGERPLIELEQTDHPLSIHYHHGIPKDELLALVHPYLK
jgi:hypothetical protein